MAEKNCAVQDCDRALSARGYCAPHYQRLMKNGSVGAEPIAARVDQGVSMREAFADKFARCESDENGCIVWPFATTEGGYGSVWIGAERRLMRAHVVAYLVNRGSIPEGQVVRHTCDNPPCVNSTHLVLGTQVENGWDASMRGRRQLVGIDADSDVPVAEQVRLRAEEIREKYGSGKYTQRGLAAEYGVVQAHIWRILHHKVYEWLDQDVA